MVLRSGKDRVFCAGANIRMLGRRLARAQGELLQVHQRDAHRDRGRERQLRPALPLRGERHRGRRRLRARARHRPHRPRRRRHLGGLAARGAAARACCPAPAASPASPTSARCAATAPTSSARSKKASRASARRRVAPGRRARCRARSSRRWWRRASRAGRALDAARGREGHHAHAARARDRGRRACATRRSRSSSTASARWRRITVHGSRGAAAGRCRRRSSREGAGELAARAARELDDAILHLRVNEPGIGDRASSRRAAISTRVLAHDAFLGENAEHWLAREIRPLLEARAQAHRPDVAHPGRADRAGLAASPARWPSWCSPPIAPTC